ncbi:MAG: hypothetical protein HQM08_09390 [Candidatus Riflebacteria bacterium]|nr:hypothetical protein [Candidatus Riflebacteria bacterium]
MNFLIWIIEKIVVPLFELFYPILDFFLKWIFRFPSIGAIALIGAMTGLGVNLFLKFSSNQLLLKNAKEDLEKIGNLKKNTSEKSELERLNSLANRISGLYAWEAVFPSLWTIPVICLVALWMGSRLSFLPPKLGNEIFVTAHFEDGAKGLAHLLPNDSVFPIGSAISKIGIPENASETVTTNESEVEARWKIKLSKVGPTTLVVRYAGKNYPLQFEIFNNSGRPPNPIKDFNSSGPKGKRLLSIEMSLQDSVSAAIWNFNLKWAGVYILSALVFGITFRWLLKLN